MQEYKSYKGKFIGAGCYSSRAEIDAAIEREAVESAEQRQESCLKSEADILSRVDLIEQAEKQLETFKATYEKAGKFLANLMAGLSTRQETCNGFLRVSFY